MPSVHGERRFLCRQVFWKQKSSLLLKNTGHHWKDIATFQQWGHHNVLIHNRANTYSIKRFKGSFSFSFWIYLTWSFLSPLNCLSAGFLVPPLTKTFRISGRGWETFNYQTTPRLVITRESHRNLFSDTLKHKSSFPHIPSYLNCPGHNEATTVPLTSPAFDTLAHTNTHKHRQAEDVLTGKRPPALN